MVNVVCGGFDSSYSFQDSCEVNIMGTTHWTTIGGLPRTLAGLRGINVGGHVLMSGNFPCLSHDIDLKTNHHI